MGTEVKEEYKNLYKVEELFFILTDERNGKTVEKWGDNPIRVLSVTEPMEMAETTDKAFTAVREYSCRLTLSDEDAGRIHMPFTENAEVKEGFLSRCEYIADYEENFTVSEETEKKVKTYNAEGIAIKDSRMRSTANGILSNVIVTEGAMTYADFSQKADQIAGYAPFVEFKVGDYEYQNAIYRIVLERKNLNANSLFYDYSVHVDIPDTLDRGECAVDGETKVYFNKSYYHAPEVNVTVVGGTDILIPRIVSLDNTDINGRYFVVTLEDMNGVTQAGRISWSARGY